jgi:hypothetical protein
MSPHSFKSLGNYQLLRPSLVNITVYKNSGTTLKRVIRTKDFGVGLVLVLSEQKKGDSLTFSSVPEWPTRSQLDKCYWEARYYSSTWFIMINGLPLVRLPTPTASSANLVRGLAVRYTSHRLLRWTMPLPSDQVYNQVLPNSSKYCHPLQLWT